MALLSFKWFLPFVASAFHPFYVSVTEINHNAREQQLEISSKFFAEDIEDVIQRGQKTTIDLSSDAQHAQNDKLVAAYVMRHISLTVDGKPANIHYLGFEKEKEALYCYFEVSGVAVAPKKMQVTDDFLHDFNEKQMNLVHVTVNGKRQSTKLDFPSKVASFSF